MKQGTLISHRCIAVFAALITIVASADLISAQAPTPIAEVPFEFIHNQIVLQVKISGRGPFNLLLDTDTDPSAIDLATARDLTTARSISFSPGFNRVAKARR